MSYFYMYHVDKWSFDSMRRSARHTAYLVMQTNTNVEYDHLIPSEQTPYIKQNANVNLRNKLSK